MKSMLIAVLVATGLSGCATRPNQSVSIDQLQAKKYTRADCVKLDQNIKFLELQLRNRGLTNADPATLSESDRVYNATTRIAIWNLRIGCTNPDRFAKR